MATKTTYFSIINNVAKGEKASSFYIRALRVPGGFHLGSLPPAGLGGTAGLQVEEEEVGLLGSNVTFAVGLLTGVEAAVTHSDIHKSQCDLT